MRLSLVTLTALLLSGCAADRPKESFSKMASEFVYTSLANSPVAATQTGYHQHGNVRLDAVLDDYSPHGIEEMRRWYTDFRLRLLRSVDVQTLSQDERADYDILFNQISLALLELQSIQSYRHNPTIYVELVGNAIYSPYVLEYADKDERYRHITARLKGIPALMAQARQNLVSVPDLWRGVAIEENQGNVSLIDGVVRQGCPIQLRPEYDEAAKSAIAALHAFSSWLQRDLSGGFYDWRLGKDLYAQKFRFVLATDSTPGQVLAAAEDGMRRMRSEMYEIARTLPGGGSGAQDQNS
ncbi:MAG: DUF885 family protein, partial [Bryobacteraceae bacterium]|nr:DUF885 family protein [Bryobacteraceae bacterium]